MASSYNNTGRTKQEVNMMWPFLNEFVLMFIYAQGSRDWTQSSAHCSKGQVHWQEWDWIWRNWECLSQCPTLWGTSDCEWCRRGVQHCLPKPLLLTKPHLLGLQWTRAGKRGSWIYLKILNHSQVYIDIVSACLYCRIPTMYKPDNYHLQSHAVPLHVTHLCLSARPPFWQQFLAVIKPTWICTPWHRSNVITYSLKILELLAFGSCTNCLDGLNWAVPINENVDLSCIMLIYWF